MTAATALIITLAGIGLLRTAWSFGRSGNGNGQLWTRWSGWLLMVAAGPLWASAIGIDRGIATAALAVMLAGIALVLHAGWRSRSTARRKRPRESRDAREVARDPGPHPLARRLWIAALAGPMAAAASLLLGLFLWLVLERVGAHPANVLTTVVMFVPLAWAALAIATTADLPLPVRTAVAVVPLAAGGLGSLALAGGLS